MPSAAAALVQHLRSFVTDERVLDAIGAVPRDRFVAPQDRARAWDDDALPIMAGQTISQPLVVARMCELLRLRGTERVLDVGTGSGYHAAVLARLAAEVHGVEVKPALVEAARANLAAAGVDVDVRLGDGSRGLPELAPFDAINVAAAGSARRLGPLVAQLGPGGRLVAPVTTNADEQVLVLLRRTREGALERTVHERVRFVPLVEGREG